LSGAGFLRIKKLKGTGIITVAARHNRRVIQAETGSAINIDPTRSSLNETLMGAATADDVGQLARDLMAAAGVGKLRKGTSRTSAVSGIEVVFSLPPDHALNDRAYFLECCSWSTVWFEGAPILSADIHRDEAQTHCHVLLLPLVNNRMVGSDLVGNKPKFLKMQKDFHDKVASRFGLQKAPDRLYGPTKAAAVAKVLQRLREAADPVLSSLVWATVREGIERDPAPYLLALGIDLPKPKAKKLKTMAQTFTGTGKGAKTEKPSPIGQAKQRPAKPLPLCSVGQDFQTTPPPANPAPPEHSISPQYAREKDAPETIRVRDSDQDPNLYDPETGEFYRRPNPVRLHRQAVDAALADLSAKQVRQSNSFSVEAHHG
jgi:hypothetical protein